MIKEKSTHPIRYKNGNEKWLKKLIFIGSSHAKRLCWEAYYIETITKFYNIVVFSHPGSLFENLVWPECSTLTKDDIIVFQSFENNLMQRHTYKD